MKRSSVRLMRLGICAALQMLSFALVAQAPSSVRENPLDLVTRAVKKEVAAVATDEDFWRYRLRKETVSGTQLREMIETKQGIVGRTLALNDRPLTTEERAQDDQRLAHLLADPEEQRKKQREQHDEEERVLRLIRALPNALLYEYDGTEKMNVRETVRLKFKPNPKFSPSDRESYVYKGTDGYLFIDAATERIVKLDATLVENVNLGWGGILGHINKGGHFLLEQTMLGQGKWKASTLILEATGKLLIFKTITLKQRQFASAYQPVPPTLDIAQAVELLKKQ